MLRKEKKVDRSNNAKTNTETTTIYKFIKHINFGIIDTEEDDMFDNVKNLGITVLINEDRDNIIVSLNGKVSAFDNMNVVIEFYVNYLLKEESLEYSENILKALIQCADEESDDGLYDNNLQETMGIEILDNPEFPDDCDDQLFCVIQHAEEIVEITGNEFKVDGDTFEKEELDDLFGYLPMITDTFCVSLPI